MNDLIPTRRRDLGGISTETVNARELHSYLESGNDFTTWIKERIRQGRFIEGRDFTILLYSQENSQAGRPRTDYHISLYMAEHLAMMERNEKGYQVRDYYIRMRRQTDRILSGQAGFVLVPVEKYTTLLDERHELTELRHALEPKYRIISEEELLKIGQLKEAGMGTTAIAKRLGRSTSGIRRAYKRHQQLNLKQGVKL